MSGCNQIELLTPLLIDMHTKCLVLTVHNIIVYDITLQVYGNSYHLEMPTHRHYFISCLTFVCQTKHGNTLIYDNIIVSLRESHIMIVLD